MKHRNFLSGLLAGPLALKARLARFFGRKPVELCNAPIGNRVMWNRADPESPEGQHSLYMSEALEALPDAFRSQGINLDGYSLVIGLDEPTSELYSAPAACDAATMALMSCSFSARRRT